MDIAPELWFFLPSQEAHIKEWGAALSERQIEYARLCDLGAQRIGQIIKDAVNGEDAPDAKKLMEEIYRVAMEERREIAFLQRDQKPDSWEKYGTPIHHAHHWVIDCIGPRVERFAAFHEKVRYLVLNLEDYLKSFGGTEHYSINGALYAQVLDEKRKTITVYRHCDQQDGALHPWLRLTAIDYNDLDRITLNHSNMADRNEWMKLMEQDLAIALEHRDNPDIFFKALGNLALCLFQGNQATLGGQTVNLMLISGIMQGLGYEVSPRTVRADHFLDADITDIEGYIGNFVEKFEKEAARKEYDFHALKDKEPVDWSARFDPQLEPEGRLEEYLRNCVAGTEIAPDIKVKSIDIVDQGDGLTLRIGVESRAYPERNGEYQAAADRLVSFIGSDRLLLELGISRERLMSKERGPWVGPEQRETPDYLQHHLHDTQPTSTSRVM